METLEGHVSNRDRIQAPRKRVKLEPQDFIEDTEDYPTIMLKKEDLKFSSENDPVLIRYTKHNKTQIGPLAISWCISSPQNGVLEKECELFIENSKGVWILGKFENLLQICIDKRYKNINVETDVDTLLNTFDGKRAKVTFDLVKKYRRSILKLIKEFKSFKIRWVLKNSILDIWDPAKKAIDNYYEENGLAF